MAALWYCPVAPVCMVHGKGPSLHHGIIWLRLHMMCAPFLPCSCFQPDLTPPETPIPPGKEGWIDHPQKFLLTTTNLVSKPKSLHSGSEPLPGSMGQQACQLSYSLFFSACSTCPFLHSPSQHPDTPIPDFPGLREGFEGDMHCLFR